MVGLPTQRASRPVSNSGPSPRLIDTVDRRVVAPMWRRAISLRSRRVVPDSVSRSMLVVAPHPDDETFGCGATIAARCAAGAEVTVVIAADGRHAQSLSRRISPDHLAAIRREEAIKACTALGLAEGRLMQFGIEDTMVEFSHDSLVDRLRSIIRSENPDDIFTTCDRDWHIDHRAVSRATRTAAAAEGRDEIFEFPIWWWIDGPRYPRPGRSRLARLAHLVGASFESVVSTQPVAFDARLHLASKRSAIAEYVSQVTNMTGEADWYVMEQDLLELFLGSREIHFRVDRLDGLRLDSIAPMEE